jgi:hypothetical protein
MSWWTDDRHLYHEQKRLDAQQAEAKRRMDEASKKKEAG